MTKILILASNDAFGEQLKMFVRDQFHCSIAGLATTSAAGLELARTTKPDVVLADVGLHGDRGIGWVNKFIELRPSVRVVLMGDGDSADYVDAAAQIGALAYVPKMAASEQLPVLLDLPVRQVPLTASNQSATSRRGLVLEGALAGGVLVGGFALSDPPVALLGAIGIVTLSRWHSARASRSTRAVGSAPIATISSQAPAVDRPHNVEGVWGGQERREQPL
ncbi:MAG: response regulator [Thermomicrobiales bacterium]